MTNHEKHEVYSLQISSIHISSTTQFDFLKGGNGGFIIEYFRNQTDIILTQDWCIFILSNWGIKIIDHRVGNLYEKKSMIAGSSCDWKELRLEAIIWALFSHKL